MFLLKYFHFCFALIKLNVNELQSLKYLPRGKPFSTKTLASKSVSLTLASQYQSSIVDRFEVLEVNGSLFSSCLNTICSTSEEELHLLQRMLVNILNCNVDGRGKRGVGNWVKH